MPTFSRSLEQSLPRALALANERRHEYATLERLLLALIDDQDASAVADPFRRLGQVFSPARLDVGNIVHASAMAPGAMKS